MKTLTLLALILVPGICSADWGIDFYRYQCVPEIGRLYLDTFFISNPDDYGKISSPMAANNAILAALAKKHEIYAVEGGGRQFTCSLPSQTLRIVLKFGSNSQGQSTGNITIQAGTETLVRDLSLFAYYGDSALVRRIEIVSDGRTPKLFASIEVIGARDRPSFTFNRELMGRSPITDASVQDEAKKHP